MWLLISSFFHPLVQVDHTLVQDDFGNLVNNMSLNIDIDVANLAVARLKCMLENWDTLANAVIDGDGTDVLVLGTL